MDLHFKSKLITCLFLLLNAFPVWSLDKSSCATSLRRTIYRRAFQLENNRLNLAWKKIKGQRCHALEDFINALEEPVVPLTSLAPQRKCRFQGRTDAYLAFLDKINSECASSCLDLGAENGVRAAYEFCGLQMMEEMGEENLCTYMTVSGCKSAFVSTVNSTCASKMRRFPERYNRLLRQNCQR